MANFKRHKPKSSRGGCLLCKPWKHQGTGKTNKEASRHSDYVRMMAAIEEINLAKRRDM